MSNMSIHQDILTIYRRRAAFWKRTAAALLLIAVLGWALVIWIVLAVAEASKGF